MKNTRLNVLISPDKFKGTLTAQQVCDAIELGLLDVDPSIEVSKLPLADGGEGSLDIIEKSLNLERVSVSVSDPKFRPVSSYYCIREGTAYIEMALASGLLLLDPDERSPSKTTTYGTGQLIFDAVNKGVHTIYLFVGGSATNDGGIGMAQALGYRFLDSAGNDLQPIGSSLEKISRIEYTQKADLASISFIVATDVRNPLYGVDGAAHVYAVQKGADHLEVEALDNGLKNLNDKLRQTFNRDYSRIPGAGAAGGIGAGAMAFLGAEIRSGVLTIMDIVNITGEIENADLVITGEGKLDEQSLAGKVVQGILQVSEKYSKPVGVICGISELKIIPKTIRYLKPLVSGGTTAEQAMESPGEFVRTRAKELISEVMKSD